MAGVPLVVGPEATLPPTAPVVASSGDYPAPDRLGRTCSTSCDVESWHRGGENAGAKRSLPVSMRLDISGHRSGGVCIRTDDTRRRTTTSATGRSRSAWHLCASRPRLRPSVGRARRTVERLSRARRSSPSRACGGSAWLGPANGSLPPRPRAPARATQSTARKFQRDRHHEGQTARPCRCLAQEGAIVRQQLEHAERERGMRDRAGRRRLIPVPRHRSVEVSSVAVVAARVRGLTRDPVAGR